DEQIGLDVVLERRLAEVEAEDPLRERAVRDRGLRLAVHDRLEPAPRGPAEDALLPRLHLGEVGDEGVERRLLRAGERLPPGFLDPVLSDVAGELEDELLLDVACHELLVEGGRRTLGALSGERAAERVLAHVQADRVDLDLDERDLLHAQPRAEERHAVALRREREAALRLGVVLARGRGGGCCDQRRGERDRREGSGAAFWCGHAGESSSHWPAAFRNSAGVCPVQRLNERWNALASEKPSRKAASAIGRSSSARERGAMSWRTVAGRGRDDLAPPLSRRRSGGGRTRR